MQASSLFETDESRDDVAPARDRTVPTSQRPVGAPTSSASLYRKYRPNSFDASELVGQDHIVRTLRNAVALNRVAHAYLFSGPRGTGKTTTARLLAKAVNCLDSDPGARPCNACANCLAINAEATSDIVEIDAASNRGIDDIRDLRDRVRYAPAQLPSKVYIIDEVHQITGAAANAFLKTLEEPPAHSRFILATTDPEQLLPTIVSRCQHFEFRRIGASETARRLRTVAEFENIAVSDGALELIARHATGSLRDGLGLLEQLALQASNPGSEPETIDIDNVRAVLGLSSNDRVEAIVQALAMRDPGAGLRTVQEAIEEGEDPRQLNRQLLSYLRLLLLELSGGGPVADEQTRQLASRFTLADLARHARQFSEIDFSIKNAPYPQLPLEVAIVEAATMEMASAPRAAMESEPVGHSPRTGQPDRPTSLRDRVRNSSPAREAASALASTPNPPEPAAIATLRPVQAPPDPALVGEQVDVEQIADLWPRVRADVKAINRRIEALLSEVDPVAISGNQITLAVPYPFHRDKLNNDDVRETVGGVLSRLLSRPISLHCILRGELPTEPGNSPSPPLAVAPRQPSASKHDPQSDTDERAESRVRAARNIFDADEIDPSEVFPEGNDPARG